jgi:FkbM family methyltransferase
MTRKPNTALKAPQNFSIADALQRANAHWNAGQADQAELLCQRVLAAWPGHADALHLKSLMAHASGNLDLAIQHLRQACLAPRAPAVYSSNLAEMCRQEGLLAEGEAAGRRAVAMDNTLAGGWNNLGIILQEAGKFEESKQCLERVLTLQPHNAEAHNNLGNTCKQLGLMQQAELNWRRALMLKPNYAEPHCNLANLLSEQGEYDKAAEHARLAIELNPRLGSAKRALAAAPDNAQVLNAQGISPAGPTRAWPEEKLVAKSDRIETARAAFVAQLAPAAGAKGVHIEYAGNGGPITVKKGKQRFIIAPEHYLYAADLCNQFDYYFSSTMPDRINGMEVVDYSRPGWHTVKGSGQRIFYTSIAEDLGATIDYMAYLTPREGEIVLDVGAYCGLSVLSFARAVGPSGKVIAFEPDPRNFEALKMNVAESGTQNVVIENKAVSGSAGKLLFSSEGNMGSAIVAKETERGNVIEVECTTLRDVVERYDLKKIGAVKLDIEGAEYGVIESSVDIIKNIRARWAVELHSDPVKKLPVDVGRVRRVFDRLGYFTFLQQDSDTAAAPTLFAVPLEYVQNTDRQQNPAR